MGDKLDGKNLQAGDQFEGTGQAASWLFGERFITKLNCHIPGKDQRGKSLGLEQNLFNFGFNCSS